MRGARANMGVSLFAPHRNLIEKLGLTALNKAVQGNFRLQEYLWDGTAPVGPRHSTLSTGQDADGG